MTQYEIWSIVKKIQPCTYSQIVQAWLEAHPELDRDKNPHIDGYLRRLVQNSIVNKQYTGTKAGAKYQVMAEMNPPQVITIKLGWSR